MQIVITIQHRYVIQLTNLYYGRFRYLMGEWVHYVKGMYTSFISCYIELRVVTLFSEQSHSAWIQWQTASSHNSQFKVNLWALQNSWNVKYSGKSLWADMLICKAALFAVPSSSSLAAAVRRNSIYKDLYQLLCPNSSPKNRTKCL